VSSPPAGPPILILLSTYNGARYLEEQVESIRAQTYRDWRLLIRDDGSQDATAEIAERFARTDSRVELLRDREGNLGPVGSFGVLLEAALQRAAPYVALADQDDVWRPDKLSLQMRLLLARERDAGSGHPVLVHSDLAVVGPDLRPIHESYLQRQRIEHVAVEPLRRLLAQNFVTGCTVVMNRALVRAAVPVPKVVMHDWWLAQLAAALGSVLFVDEPTVQYRQHAGNVLGSRGYFRMYLDTLRQPRAIWAREGRFLGATGAQACVLAARLRELPEDLSVPPEELALVESFCRALAGGTTRLGRVRLVQRLGIHPRARTYPIYFYLRVFCGASLEPSPASQRASSEPGPREHAGVRAELNP
jgi:hypothetical protein